MGILKQKQIKRKQKQIPYLAKFSQTNRNPQTHSYARTHTKSNQPQKLIEPSSSSYKQERQRMKCSVFTFVLQLCFLFPFFFFFFLWALHGFIVVFSFLIQ